MRRYTQPYKNALAVQDNGRRAALAAASLIKLSEPVQALADRASQGGQQGLWAALAVPSPPPGWASMHTGFPGGCARNRSMEGKRGKVVEATQLSRGSKRVDS